MSDSQGETSGTSTGESISSGTVDISEPSTSSQHSKMGVESKLSSSSREMRNMAEKMRRDKLNNYVAEIAGIVPLGSGANKRIDKTSVLRLAANYIRMHKILKDDDDDGSNKIPQNLSKELTSTLAEAVGGFLLVVTSSGKVVYITEAVDQFFGHTQVDLLGHSIYNVIHPDDRDIFQQQLVPKDNCRRSFFCRMMEKALSRNDPGRYEIIHVVGQLRPLPQVQQSSLPSCSVTSPVVPSPSETNSSSDHDDDESSDNEGEMQSLKVANRTGTHMLVSFVRVVKDRPITELSLVESTQEEYITRHGMDGKILYTDHRISFVTGLMPSEVIGTSAFNYMHQDDIVWSIVAQKLMFTSSQGQGIVSYRLRCRDGAHITLRSRGFLEVNKQTGQVESFVCINTVLSIKEANLEIKNQRRKLLPIIACHESEDHLGSISSSLPPELMMVLKQIMNPETMRKMIESVKSSELLESERSAATAAASLNPSPTTSADSLKDTDHGCIGHPFQTKPKRLCSEVSTYQSVPEPCVSPKSVDKDQWQRMTKKRSSVDDYSTIASKKFNLEADLPCPELLHPNYSANTVDQQFSPRTASLQPSLSPTTSLVPENIKNYPSGTCQQYSSSMRTSDSNSHSHSVSSSVIHPKISQHYQNSGALSPGSYWQQETQPASPTPRQCGQIGIAPEKDNHRISQNLPSPTGYSQRIAANVPTSSGYVSTSPGYVSTSPGYDQSKGNGSLSPGICEQRLTDSENTHIVHHQRISGGLASPDNCNQSRAGAISTSSNVLQNRCRVMPSHDSHNQGIGSYNQSASPGVPSPGNCSQNISQGLPSVGNYNHNERKPHSPAQDCDQSGSGNISSSSVPSPCSYQFNISSPKDQSTPTLQNQLFPQYQQASYSTPHPMNQPQYQYPIPFQEQSFALSNQASSSTSPGHYSEFPPQLQKQLSPHARQVPANQEIGHQAVPIFTTESVSFGETGTSGVPSVPEPTIPEQHSSLEDPLSKDTGNMFANGHFQHYPTHNQHGGKLL